MTLFIALLKQWREGCDYTIGCGIKWIELKSRDKEAAFNELYNTIIGQPQSSGYPSGYDGHFWGDHELESVILLEIADRVIIPVTKWYSDAKQVVELKRMQKFSDAEYAEYQRLKAKFERGGVL